jgi:hypothetical protein
VDDFLDTEELGGLLHVARSYISQVTYNDIVNTNEIHLVCVKDGGDWRVEVRSIIKPTLEDIKVHTLQLSKVEEFDLMQHTRKQPIPLVRSIISAAYYHFLNMTFTQMEDHLPICRSTLYTGCNKALPEFLRSNDLLANQTIRAISHRYGDPSFLVRCQEGNFTRNPRYVDN